MCKDNINVWKLFFRQSTLSKCCLFNVDYVTYIYIYNHSLAFCTYIVSSSIQMDYNDDKAYKNTLITEGFVHF